MNLEKRSFFLFIFLSSVFICIISTLSVRSVLNKRLSLNRDTELRREVQSANVRVKKFLNKQESTIKTLKKYIGESTSVSDRNKAINLISASSSQIFLTILVDSEGKIIASSDDENSINYSQTNIKSSIWYEKVKNTNTDEVLFSVHKVDKSNTSGLFYPTNFKWVFTGSTRVKSDISDGYWYIILVYDWEELLESTLLPVSGNVYIFNENRALIGTSVEEHKNKYAINQDDSLFIYPDIINNVDGHNTIIEIENYPTSTDKSILAANKIDRVFEHEPNWIIVSQKSVDYMKTDLGKIVLLVLAEFVFSIGLSIIGTDIFYEEN